MAEPQSPSAPAPKVTGVTIEQLCQRAKLRPDQEQRAQLIRDLGEQLVEMILRTTARCADQMAAVRKVREAVWTTEAAIGLEDTPGAQPPAPEAP